MANIVQVSTQEATSANGKLKNNLEEAYRQIDALLEIVRGTENWWEGETTMAFIQSFEEGTRIFKNYLDKLQQHGDAMVSSVARQHSHDASLAQQIRKF